VKSTEANPPRQNVGHVHVIGVEPSPREHRGHFHLAVDALFTQDGNRRPRAADDERRGHIGAWLEAQGRMQTRIINILEPRIFLARAIRIVAQLLHAKRHLAPTSMQDVSRASINHAAIGADLHLRARGRLADLAAQRRQSVSRQNRARLREARRRHLHDRSQLLGKRRRNQVGNRS